MGICNWFGLPPSTMMMPCHKCHKDNRKRFVLDNTLSQDLSTNQYSSCSFCLFWKRASHSSGMHADRHCRNNIQIQVVILHLFAPTILEIYMDLCARTPFWATRVLDMWALWWQSGCDDWHPTSFCHEPDCTKWKLHMRIFLIMYTQVQLVFTNWLWPIAHQLPSNADQTISA